MSLFSIALKSLRQRALASSLTALSVALGVMLVVAVLLVGRVVNETFNRRSIAYDLIVGPKGSDMQLVLSTVYRVEPPIANLPFLFYKQLAADPVVESAVPVAFGDLTQVGGFPIVGTTEDYFKWGYAPGKPYLLVGKRMNRPFDSVIGSEVARKNGWSVGTQFQLVHGGAETGHVHEEKFTVSGVLEQTGTPDDRTAFVNLEGFYLVSGHEKPMSESINAWRDFNGLPPLAGDELAAELAKHGGEHVHDHSHGGDDHAHHHAHTVPDIQKEVTAVLIRFKRAEEDEASIVGPLWADKFRRGYKVQAVNPIKPMQRLQEQFIGNIRDALLALSAVILVVSGVGIFVSIYNSMSERLREIAIMRALGARRETVFSVILTESLLLCLGGGLVGAALGHLLVIAATPLIRAKTNLLVDPYAFDMHELWLVPALAVLAILAGLLPGLRAYRADVAESLME